MEKPVYQVFETVLTDTGFKFVKEAIYLTEKVERLRKGYISEEEFKRDVELALLHWGIKP